ncbi:Hypothetical predicted protein [Mytilus galloprovincialis]|nr:Hypothetical predicted protein [Mytilus galloprovincialis]
MTWTRDASTDSLIAHSEKTTWLDSFESCKDGFGGSAIFEYCQPSTCKASNAIGKIANISSNKVEYWINGFVQRSPVVVYEGCYYIKSAAVSKIHSDRGRFNLSDNSVFSCSYKCPGLTEGDFIFLNNKECLCVPITSYETISGDPRISPAECDNVCPGSSTDICGGQRTTNFTLFSGYMYVKKTEAKQFKKSIGKTCGTNNTGKLIFDFCQKPRQGVCVDVNESGEVV